MAHFAQLDENNIVQQVIVISNEDLLDEHGDEQEYIGVFVCNQIFGPGSKWVQTSYNSNFRKQYAGIGMKFDESANVFYDPNPPFASWVLDSNFDWQAPVARPTEVTEGQVWAWNEEVGNWESVAAPVLPGGE